VGYGYKLVRNEEGTVVKVRDEDVALDPILDAVRQAGSILGGAKLLQAQGIPSPEGKTVWGSTTLRRIIEDNAPELIPGTGPTGRRQPSRSSELAQLLICHCGHTLTPEPQRRAYRCRMGVRQGRDVHGPMHATWRSLRDWVKAEAALLEIPAQAVVMEGIEARQDAIEARLSRAHDLFIAGDIDRPKYETEKARAKRDMDALAGQAAVAQVAPVVDWDNPPDVINAALRSIWRGVQLGPDMEPVSADWIVPEWRAETSYSG
jgi:hypothetical protein